MISLDEQGTYQCSPQSFIHKAREIKQIQEYQKAWNRIDFTMTNNFLVPVKISLLEEKSKPPHHLEVGFR